MSSADARERDREVALGFRPFVPPHYQPMAGPDDIGNLPGISDAARDAARQKVEEFASEAGGIAGGAMGIYAAVDKSGGVDLLIFSGGVAKPSGDGFAVGGKGESAYSHVKEGRFPKSKTNHSVERGERVKDASDDVGRQEVAFGIDKSGDFAALGASYQFYQISPHGDYACKKFTVHFGQGELVAFAGWKLGEKSGKGGIEFGVGGAACRIEIDDVAATAPIPFLENWRITRDFHGEVNLGGFGAGIGAGVFRDGNHMTLGVHWNAYAGDGAGMGFNVGLEAASAIPGTPRRSGILDGARIAYNAVIAVAKQALDSLARFILDPVAKERKAPIPQIHTHTPKHRPWHEEEKKKKPDQLEPPWKPGSPPPVPIDDDPPHGGRGRVVLVDDGDPPGGGGGGAMTVDDRRVGPPPPPSTSGLPTPPQPSPSTPGLQGVSLEVTVSKRSSRRAKGAERDALLEKKRWVLGHVEGREK